MVDYTAVVDYVSVPVDDDDVVVADAAAEAAVADDDLQAVLVELAKKRVHPCTKGFSAVQNHSSPHLPLRHSNSVFAPSVPSSPNPHGRPPC